MVSVAVWVASVTPPDEMVTMAFSATAEHMAKVEKPWLAVPCPLAGRLSCGAIGSMTGQPGGIVVPSGPTYRPDQMSVTWIGWPVQFSATRVRVDDWPALTAGGLKANESI